MKRAKALNFLAAVLVSSCGPIQTNGDVEINYRALVVTTDYQTGSYALLEPARPPRTNIDVIHPDAVCRVDRQSKSVFLVSRLGADAIEILDPVTLRIVSEYSLGPGSNPQDVAVSDGKLFVPLLARAEMAVLDGTTGERLKGVDLSSLADADGIPEAAWAIAHRGKVYVALQLLDNFQPTDRSLLAVVDPSTLVVDKVIELVGADPFGKMRLIPGTDLLVLADVGRFGQQDGGLELVDTTQEESLGFVITEAELGGDIVDAVMLDRKRGFVVVSQPVGEGNFRTRLVSFDTEDGSEQELDSAKGFEHSFIELSPDGRELWATRRSIEDPGVLVFSAENGSRLTPNPVDVGLPPFMICFLP